MDEEIWLPLVDEPLGELVARIQAGDEEIAGLVAEPRRQLAFRTFAYIRVGILLGRLLVERDIDPREGGAWIERLLEDPGIERAVVEEVRTVAREVAADPKLAGESLGPDETARERFREFARRVDQ
ncbi:MAG: hypothetical protein ACRDON_03030 [Gaiellaceae bacterium]